MRTRDEYLAKAAECEHLAAYVKDDETREQYRRLAQQWRDLARQTAWRDGESEGGQGR